MTGASCGQGTEFTRQLAAPGGNLILIARSVDWLAALAGELQDRYRVTVTAERANLRRADEVSRVAALTTTSQVDVLVTTPAPARSHCRNY